MKKNSLVSVIVPTKNSSHTIDECLQSIKDQTYSNIEIMVIDNYSRDKTKEIAGKYGRVLLKGPERSAQRNFGARRARGEYVFFVDSDMELTPRVVEECLGEIRLHAPGAVIVPEISVGVGFWARCKALEKRCYIGDDTIEAARFFKKEVFWKVGEYDEDLIAAEDWDLSQRIKKAGFAIGRISALVKHQEGRLGLTKTVKKKFGYGVTIGRYIKKHKKESKRQLILIRPAFLRNYTRLLKNPITTVGLIVMKTCEFIAGTAGFAVGKIKKIFK